MEEEREERANILNPQIYTPSTKSLTLVGIAEANKGTRAGVCCCPVVEADGVLAGLFVVVAVHDGDAVAAAGTGRAAHFFIIDAGLFSLDLYRVEGYGM